MSEPEIWHEVVSGDVDLSHYQVSNYGNVRHVDRANPRQITINDKGFPVITLFGKDSKTRYLRHINKLVASAFLPPPHYAQDNYVWHIDGDLLNCYVGNLRWEMRSRVLEWNEMHRSGTPQYRTPPVRNNRTGAEYANAYECAMAEGVLESSIVFRIERQARGMDDDNARYRYL